MKFTNMKKITSHISFLIRILAITLFLLHGDFLGENTKNIPFVRKTFIEIKKNLDIGILNENNDDGKTVFLFSHGLHLRTDAGKRCAQRNIHTQVITGTCVYFEYKDIHLNLDFGQTQDYEKFLSALAWTKNEFPTRNIVLIGVSRGCTPILRYLTECNDPQIKAIVLESPFDSVENAIAHIATTYLAYLPYSDKILRLCLGVSQYNTQGYCTIDHTNIQNKYLPIFCAYFTSDLIVPPTGTKRIIAEFKKYGCSPTILELNIKNGRHGHLYRCQEYIKHLHKFYYHHCINLQK